MSNPWIDALAAVAVVSILPLLALPAVWLDPKLITRIRMGLVSLAVGALMGDAFLHLLPDAFGKLGSGTVPALLTIAGFGGLFLLDLAVHAHHHETEEDQGHAHAHTVQGRPSLIVIAVTGTGLHNFMDGLLIGATFLVRRDLGIATAMAIVLHEIPHELGDVGVLLHGGLALKRAIIVNFLCGLAAIAGTLTALVMGQEARELAIYILPVGAGAFIYLAGSVLLPEIRRASHGRVAWIHSGLVAAGVGAMGLLLLME